MAIGVITSSPIEARRASAWLERHGHDHMLLGFQGNDFRKRQRLPFLTRGRYLESHLDHLADEALGLAPAGAVAELDVFVTQLRQNRIDRVVNVGTFNALLYGLQAARSMKGEPAWPSWPRRAAVLALADRLVAENIQCEWLAHAVPLFGIGGEVRNVREAGVTDALIGAALAATTKALTTAASLNRLDSRSALTAVYQDGDHRAELSDYTDTKLDTLSQEPPPRSKRVMVRLAWPGQCPLDPPSIGPMTIEAAARANVSGIIISRDRGAVFQREETLSKAASHGIAIIAI